MRAQRGPEARIYAWLRSSIRRHVRKDGFASIEAWEYGTGLFFRDLLAQWTTKILTGRCPHCGRRWVVPGSQDEVARPTLDRIDADAPITSLDSIRLLCMSGNRNKQKTPLPVDDVKQRCWALYDERRRVRERFAPLQVKLDLA